LAAVLAAVDGEFAKLERAAGRQGRPYLRVANTNVDAVIQGVFGATPPPCGGTPMHKRFDVPWSQIVSYLESIASEFGHDAEPLIAQYVNGLDESPALKTFLLALAKDLLGEVAGG